MHRRPAHNDKKQYGEYVSKIIAQVKELLFDLKIIITLLCKRARMEVAVS